MKKDCKNCDCLEIAERGNGGMPVKNYPCLNREGVEDLIKDFKATVERKNYFGKPFINDELINEVPSYPSMIMKMVEDNIEKVIQKVVQNCINDKAYDPELLRRVNDDQCQREDGICSLYYGGLRLGLIKINASAIGEAYNLSVDFEPNNYE